MNRKLKTPGSSHGLVLGKFYPPHLGHQYLIEFAYRYVDQLTIVVEEMPRETLPVALRASWLTSLFPKAEILQLKDQNPQDPSETPEFWAIWESSLKRIISEPLDYVFASEAYGNPLAKCLDAEFIPVDPNRERYPTSGTQIRQNPYKHWQYLSLPVKQYYQKRICVCGPESTGKSTLSQWLTEQLNQKQPSSAQLTSEYARTYLESRNTALEHSDIERIALGQNVSEQCHDTSPSPFHIIDTGVKASQVWGEFLFNKTSNMLVKLCQETNYDLYLLCHPDIPWVKDGIRYLPKESHQFYNRLKEVLSKEKSSTVIEVFGQGQARQKLALDACLDVIDNAI
ncbi:AAA family ATPase [Teredinibacter sp. KSP-S5-2]|uniref:AAA family ATPase n=1 Tax=Teredinibacter sp. KSP-S5-2 TaxID=3034506 RepID=UPI0029346E95|nr:AAA family ATPase [Teredinibacter sp. KSP-S5-2]WNO10852.1 AAA family ATPase [Teredinibacter sp. KSP-S5-2]